MHSESADEEKNGLTTPTKKLFMTNKTTAIDGELYGNIEMHSSTIYHFEAFSAVDECASDTRELLLMVLMQHIMQTTTFLPLLPVCLFVVLGN